MTRVGEIEVTAKLEDGDLLAGLARAEAAVKRTAAKIEAERAEAKFGADISKLERDLAKAEALIDKFDKRRADATLTVGQRRYAKEQLAKQQEIQKALQDQIAAQKQALAAQKQQTAEMGRQERLAAAQEQLERTKTRLLDEQAKRRSKAAADEAKAFAADEKRRAKRMRDEEREFSKIRKGLNEEENLRFKVEQRIEKAARKGEQRAQRELDEVPRLEAAYVKLQDRLERIARAKYKARRDERQKIIIDVEEAEVLGRIEHLRGEIRRRIGRDPIGLPVKMDLAGDAGRYLRGEIMRHSTLGMAGAAVGTAVGTHLGRGVISTASKVITREGRQEIGGAMRAVGRNAVEGVARGSLSMITGLGARLGALSQASVRIGPFTTSLRGLMGALTVLGPTLFDIIGTLGSLVSTVGSATLGVGALATGFVGGAIPAAVGFGLVIAGVAKQFSSAMKASKSYNDAVLKYGKGSDQAKKKAEELAHVLGSVDKETMQAFQSATKLSDRWNKATAPARASAFEAIGEGIKFAGDNMDMFAKNTNEGMDILSASTREWLSQLNTSSLDTMMDNFNASLADGVKGIGHILDYLVEVGRVASGQLPGLAMQFRNWSQNLFNTTQAGDFEAKINRVIQSTRTLGRFFMSGGRLLKSFFSGGVDAGDDFVQTMTNAMDRWTMFLNTIEGRNQLEDFFSQSTTGAQALWGAIAPIGESFADWAIQIAPVVSAFLKGAGAVTGFVNSILEATALRGPVTALVATLGALWAVGRIAAATAAIGRFTAALLGLSRAQAAVSAVQAGGGLLGALGGAGGAAAATRGAAAARSASAAQTAAAAASVAAASRTGQAAAQGAQKVGLLRAAAQSVVPAIAGMGAVSGGLATAGLLTLAGAAVYGGYKLMTMKTETEKLDAAWRTAAEAGRGVTESTIRYVSATTAAEQASKQYKGTLNTVSSLKKTLNRLESEGKTNTDQYRTAQSQLRGALRTRAADEQRAGQAAFRAAQQGADATIRYARSTEAERLAKAKLVTSSETLKKAQEDLNRARKIGGPARIAYAEERVRAAYDQTKDSLTDYRNAQKQLREAMNAQAASYPSLQRALKGMVGLTPKATQAIGALRRTTGGKDLSVKIATKFEDPKDVQRVAAKAQAALNSGTPKKVVTKAALDSGSAKQALAELNKAKITPKRMKIISEGGPQALAQLRNIVGTKLAPKVQRILENGASSTQSKINALRALGIPAKTARILAQDGASGKIKEVDDKKISPKRALIRAIDNASSVLNRVIELANGAPNVSRSITYTYNVKGKPPAGPRGPNWAAGGVASYGTVTTAASGFQAQREQSGALPDARKIERAFGTAELSGKRKTRGGRYSQPTMLVGEENRSEFVVSTNPKYRQRNRGYARMAALAVGLRPEDLDKRAKQMADQRNAQVLQQGIVAAASGGFSGGSYTPSTKLPPKPPPREKAPKNIRRTSPGFRKRKARAYLSGRGYVNYIGALKVQQDDWEREAGIRESLVEEPSDVLVEVGRIKDPKTGEDLGPQMAPNVAAIEKYQQQLSSVEAAFEQLMKIVAEIVRAVPLALGAIDVEKVYRKANIKNLTSAISKDEKIVDNKKSSKEAKKNARHRLAKNRPALEHEREQLAQISEDRKTLVEDRKEAGFDNREYEIRRNEAKADREGIMGKATAEAKAENAQTSGTGSGSGGSDSGSGDTGTMGLNAQAALTAQQNAETLKAFGSNFIGGGVASQFAAAVNVGGSAGAGQGMQQNLAGAGNVTQTSALAAGIMGSPAASALGTSDGAAGAVAARSGGVGSSGGIATGGVSAGQVDNSKTVNTNIVNNFQQPPADPVTWSKGVEFELGTL